MFKFGHSFTSHTPVATTEDSTDYADDNLVIYGFLRRQWRSTSTAQNTIACAFGASRAIVAVVLDDCNFTNVTIGGTDFTIGADTRVNRYKLWADKTATGSSMDIVIPASQAPTDGLTKYRIGRIIFLTAASILTLSANVTYPYEYSSPKPYRVTDFESGGREKVKLGDYKVFQANFQFKNMDDAYESQLITLDNINEDEEIVFYENEGDTSKVYVVHKEGSIKISEPAYGIRETVGILVKEVI